MPRRPWPPSRRRRGRPSAVVGRPRPRRRRRRSAARTPRARVRAGVLERVGERLLDDAGRPRAAARAGAARGGAPLTSSVDRQARRADLLEQLVELRRARAAARSSPRSARPSRSTPSSRRISVSAWRPVRDAVLHRAARALLGLVVGRRRSAPSASAIITDEVVGDDVVHLARDPRALGGGREPALLVALALQARPRAPPARPGAPPVARARAQHARPRSPSPESPTKTRSGLAAGGPPDGGEHDAELEHGGRRERRSRRRLGGGDGVERGEQRDVAERDDAERPLHQRDARERREDGHRRSAGATAAGAARATVKIALRALPRPAHRVPGAEERRSRRRRRRRAASRWRRSSTAGRATLASAGTDTPVTLLGARARHASRRTSCTAAASDHDRGVAAEHGEAGPGREVVRAVERARGHGEGRVDRQVGADRVADRAAAAAATTPGSTNSRPTNAAMPPAVLRSSAPSPSASAPRTVRNSAVPTTARSACGIAEPVLEVMAGDDRLHAEERHERARRA